MAFPDEALRVYTVSEVARLLSTTSLTIRKEIRSGRLKAARWGDVSLRILHEDLVAYLHSRPAIEPAACRQGRKKAVEA